MAGRRSNGEGSVQKLKSGTWRCQLMDGYTPDGKKNIVSFTAPTKAEAQLKMRKYLAEKDAGMALQSKKLLLSAWADSWYADYRSQVAASTYSGYYFTLQLIKKNLGDWKVCEVLPIDINRFMDLLVETGYSLSQIRKCRTMLIQIFDEAENNRLVTTNPARKAKIIRDKDGTLSAPQQIKDSFDAEEQRILYKDLPHDLLGHSIRVLLDTGIRVQELLALEPKDIAEDGSEINVNKAIKTVAGKPVLGPPKSKRGYRKVPVPARCRDSAKYLREHGGKQFIWSLPGKNPFYSVGAFRRRYYTALKQLDGVRLLSPHCCRHTYVTRLQAKGVPLELIAKLAGHSSISTTDGYAHTSMETLKSTVSLLDNDKESN